MFEQVTPKWMEEQQEAYKALCRLWASEEWIERSKSKRGNRGKEPGHNYGGDGHLRKARRMVIRVLLNLVSILNIV